jgi:ATP-binding cassette, subfamily C (CFTR/MRP), member 1
VLKEYINFIAVLFDGSLRYNIDPLQSATDGEIYAALRRVGLLEADTDPTKSRFDLNSEIRDDSFSAGEKQLVALCRALVKKAKVIVLVSLTSIHPHRCTLMMLVCLKDEATAR